MRFDGSIKGREVASSALDIYTDANLLREISRLATGQKSFNSPKASSRALRPWATVDGSVTACRSSRAAPT